MDKANQLMNLNRMELMGNLRILVKSEKELTLEILDHLQEVANRKLFLEMGYSSLFTFLTEELEYCSGTAYLRMQTMKALEVPENRDRVLNDKTSLNTLAKTQSFINNENKSLGKQSEPLLTEKEKQEFFAAAEGASANKVEEVLKEKKHEMEVKKSNEHGLPPPVKKLLKKFNFEADPELVGMIEEIKSLLSHTVPGGELSKMLKKALPLAIQEIKIKKGLTKRSEATSTNIMNTAKIDSINSENKTSSMKPHSIKKEQTSPALFHKSWEQKRRITRSIPVELKRKVWKRDGGCCQYQDPVTGKRCSSRHKLEFEHTKPWSLGGEHSLENLWIICRNHNIYRWNNIAK